DIVENWTPRLHPLANPQYYTLQGQYCRLELLNSKTNNNTIQQLFNDTAVGFIAFANVNQEYGTIEIGHVNFSAQLLRTRSATEANYLLLHYAFDILSFRRVEWPCNALNAKSRRAALRLGFQYEGTWIKSDLSRGQSRDKSWFSIVDDEWVQLIQEFQRWLSSANFDSNGQQLTKLNAAQINPRSNKKKE
ncbi:unnamed protein product, partial [Rotaria sordida]